MSMVRLSSLLRRFAGDESGNIALLFGITALMLLTGGGLAVEFSRAMTVRSAMSNALDAAVLATARSVSVGEITQDEAEDYLYGMFTVNMNAGGGDLSGYRIEDVTFDNVTKTLSADVTYGFETMFRFFGESNSLALRTSAAAIYGTSYAEVAMAFDVTGSMSGGKLDNLKAAAIAGVTQLLGEENNPTVRISAIPYAEAVNVGDLARHVFPDDGKPDTAPVSAADWEAAMESGTPPPGVDEDAWNEDMLAGGGTGGLGPDDCATERKGPHIYDPAGPDRAMVNRDARLEVCPTARLMPLTNDADALVAAINSYRHNGVTAGQIGIQWAWYTLSHEWADFLPAGAGPLDPEAPYKEVRKFAVIMTDGEFNTAFAGSRRQKPQQKEARRSSDHALELCRRMKADGIRIFTIGFQLKQDRAIQVMRDCASPADGQVQYFYDTSSAAELTDAYRSIAGTIQALRLVR